MAQNLGIPALSFAGLHEHERADVVFGIRGNFETLLANFFAKPKQLIFGRETAEQALERFSQCNERCVFEVSYREHSRGYTWHRHHVVDDQPGGRRSFHFLEAAGDAFNGCLFQAGLEINEGD